mmetsp:Transcript_23246/g.65867  ORF Transcript_23246/g.65867 Transcript_23246/m.65867 type:complete len:217 (+) Transcript_23246:895-1545(+)
MDTVRHAISASLSKAVLNTGKRKDPMTICVTEAPRFPHPPTRALAVPTTSLVNMRLDQYWHITKVPPATPMKRRSTARPVAVCTRPVHAVGMEAEHRTTANKMRAPYLSHPGPRTKRMKMVPPTPTMLEVHTSCLVILRSSRISPRSGAMANQMKKAMKKHHHEQWKARMCGRAKLQSLISVALSSCSGSTATAYVEYFFHSPAAPESTSIVVVCF